MPVVDGDIIQVFRNMGKRVTDLSSGPSR
jgi:hypothetical protein